MFTYNSFDFACTTDSPTIPCSMSAVREVHMPLEGKVKKLVCSYCGQWNRVESVIDTGGCCLYCGGKFPDDTT